MKVVSPSPLAFFIQTFWFCSRISKIIFWNLNRGYETPSLLGNDSIWLKQQYPPSVEYWFLWVQGSQIQNGISKKVDKTSFPCREKDVSRPSILLSFKPARFELIIEVPKESSPNSLVFFILSRIHEKFQYPYCSIGSNGQTYWVLKNLYH